jgi:hypothetical protein
MLCNKVVNAADSVATQIPFERCIKHMTNTNNSESLDILADLPKSKRNNGKTNSPPTSAAQDTEHDE